MVRKIEIAISVYLNGSGSSKGSCVPIVLKRKLYPIRSKIVVVLDN
jgi:hypothetical protein